jgi:hypothetical protein
MLEPLWFDEHIRCSPSAKDLSRDIFYNETGESAAGHSSTPGSPNLPNLPAPTLVNMTTGISSGANGGVGEKASLWLEILLSNGESGDLTSVWWCKFHHPAQVVLTCIRRSVDKKAVLLLPDISRILLDSWTKRTVRSGTQS